MSTVVTSRVPDELAAALTDEANDRGLSRSKYIGEILANRHESSATGPDADPSPVVDDRPLDGGDASDAEPSPDEEATPPTTDPSDVSLPTPEEVREEVWTAVDAVAEPWDSEDARYDDRRTVAAIALQLALDVDGYLRQNDPVFEELRERHPVAGQSETWYWRRNIRAVLSEYGTHAPNVGYRVDSLSLGDEQ